MDGSEDRLKNVISIEQLGKEHWSEREILYVSMAYKISPHARHSLRLFVEMTIC